MAAMESPADEQLEVGVAVVGGGPAGLACAIRLAQLIEADPAVAERLGETPIALVDKGRTVGAHQLSGAVVQPAPLLELFPGVSLEQMTSYGPVESEAVYLLTSSRAARLPIVPPPMHNKGNHVFSLARLARFMAERAEELGVMVPPETDAQRVLVTDGAVLTAQATVLADGVQGMLSGAAIEHFGLEPENPQIYALGVKEVWRVARPLDRVVHTIGWPLKPQARYREFGGTFAYPMGSD